MFSPDQQRVTLDACAIADDEIKLIVFKHFREPPVRLDNDVNINLRILIPKRPKDVNETGCCEILHDPKSDPSLYGLAV